MTAVAVILKGYPRLSETFIAQEILALERRGLDLRIVSLRHPTDKDIHPVHREIGAPVSITSSDSRLLSRHSDTCADKSSMASAAASASGLVINWLLIHPNSNIGNIIACGGQL